jgi:hypothetical protein
MDPFLVTFWNLDQIRGWAETRDPEMVRAAALPKYATPPKTLKIAVPSTHAATGPLCGGRDVDGELWAASGWAPQVKKFVPPPMVKEFAEKHNRPAFALVRYNNFRVERPADTSAAALRRAWTFAFPDDRAAIVALLREHGRERDLLADTRFAGLPDHLSAMLREFVLSPEAHGPPNVYVRDLFPTR